MNKNNLLEYSEEDVYEIRKKFNLEAPGRMEEAIQLLVDWMKQHPHFINSDLIPKSYLEMGLINSKGSIERTKNKILNTLSLKSTLPELMSNTNYSVVDFKKISDVIYFGLYPKLDDNLYRYTITQVRGGPYSTEVYLNYLRYVICVINYGSERGYCDGYMMVLDYTDTKLLEAVAVLNPMDLKNFSTVLTQGFGLRLKGLHIILNPSSIGAILDKAMAIIKSVVPEKLRNRIHIHRSRASLTDVLQMNRLPAEYGDQTNMTMKELHDTLMEAVCSKEHMESLKKFENVYLDDSYKKTDEFSDCIHGSFRKLTVD